MNDKDRELFLRTALYGGVIDKDAQQREQDQKLTDEQRKRAKQVRKQLKEKKDHG